MDDITKTLADFGRTFVYTYYDIRNYLEKILPSLPNERRLALTEDLLRNYLQVEPYANSILEALVPTLRIGPSEADVWIRRFGETNRDAIAKSSKVFTDYFSTRLTPELLPTFYSYFRWQPTLAVWKELLSRDEAAELLQLVWRQMVASGNYRAVSRGVFVECADGQPKSMSMHSIVRSSFEFLGPSAGLQYARLVLSTPESSDPTRQWLHEYGEILATAGRDSLHELVSFWIKIIETGIGVKDVVPPEETNEARRLLKDRAAFEARVERELTALMRNPEHRQRAESIAKFMNLFKREAPYTLRDFVRSNLEDELKAKIETLSGTVKIDYWVPYARTVIRGIFWSASGVMTEALMQRLEEAILKERLQWEEWSPVVVGIGMSLVPGRDETLSRLKAKVKNKPVLKTIERMLKRAAESAGLTTEEFEDRLVSTYDLSPAGSRQWQSGNHVAVLRLTDRGEASLSVFDKSKNKELRSVPDELSEAKELRKKLQATLTTQKIRLEKAMCTGRSWDARAWTEIFAANPVLNNLASRLVWRVGVSLQMPPLSPKADNRLLIAHPLQMTADELRAWRAHVSGKGIVQPFKQMFREIYRVQEHERTQDQESSRFAGQIVPMKTLYALTKSRGWSGFYGSGSYWSGEGEGYRAFPDAGIAAVMLTHPSEVRSEDTDYVVFENLFFVRSTKGRAAVDAPRVPLADVAPLIFSETVRDLELIVSVSSVGLESMIKGARELSPETLDARKEALMTILYQLKLERQVTFRGSFVVVTGATGSFRIHLGSGHVYAMDEDRRIDVRLDALPEEMWAPAEDDVRLAEIAMKVQTLIGMPGDTPSRTSP